MRTALLLTGLVAVSVALLGCGGGSSGGGGGTTNPLTTTRVLAGFVYAKGNSIGSGPEVVITTSANPPTGYFAPSSGSVTLNVADGTLTRSPDSEVFDMATSNAIVVSAVAAPSSNVAISSSSILLDGVGKALAGYNISLGPVEDSGTVETIQSPDAPVYTPGAPEELRLTIDGNPITTPKELFIAGAPIGSGGDRSLSIIALDSNHVINTSATFTVTSATNGVSIAGSGASRTLSPGTALNSSVEGDTLISVQIVGVNVTESFLANFVYGSVGTILVTPGSNLLLWAASGVPASTGISVFVTNTFNAPMFAQAVSLTIPGKVASNVWITQAGATAFTAASGATDNTGHFTTTLTAPVSSFQGGGLNLTPKGVGAVTATIGASTGFADVKVIRPLSTVVIAGPVRIDVATTTPAGSVPGSYQPTGGVDVDGLGVLITDYPALSLVYTVTNSVGGAPFGNTGDQSLPTVSTSAIMVGSGNENRVVAGNTAGKFAIQVTGGVTTPSNIVTTEVYGNPAKLSCIPNTNTVNIIPGAQGNFSGASGSTVDVTFNLWDSAGHGLPSGEITYNSTFTLGSGTGGNVTSGGVYVNQFTLTFGPNDGLLTVLLNNGVWSGLSGTAARQFNLSKNYGHDAN